MLSFITPPSINLSLYSLLKRGIVVEKEEILKVEISKKKKNSLKLILIKTNKMLSPKQKNCLNQGINSQENFFYYVNAVSILIYIQLGIRRLCEL